MPVHGLDRTANIRAVLGRHYVPERQPRHGTTHGPGWHEPEGSRAGPCLDRAKFPCCGPAHGPPAPLAIYKRHHAPYSSSFVTPRLVLHSWPAATTPLLVASATPLVCKIGWSVGSKTSAVFAVKLSSYYQLIATCTWHCNLILPAHGTETYCQLIATIFLSLVNSKANAQETFVTGQCSANITVS